MMILKDIDFNDTEKELIVNIGVELIDHSYFTALNLINSGTIPLPQSSIIIHYLQDSRNQIKYVIRNIKNCFPYSDDDLIFLPRLTFYNLDPKYTKKPGFKREYQNAVFLDKKLEQVSIEEVILNPFDKIICNNELDLLIPINKDINLMELANFILSEERDGPEPWIDPAIIIRSENEHEDIEGFVKKDYCSIRRNNSEFYTILFNEMLKQELERFLKKICTQLKDNLKIKLDEDSVLFLRGDINTELDDYIRRNLRDFKPLSP